MDLHIKLLCESKNLDFIQACKCGDIELIKKYLNYGVNINHKNSNGNTGFMYACSGLNIEIINLLINNDEINHNIVNIDGFTALNLICYLYNVRYLENKMLDFSMYINVIKLLILNDKININIPNNNGNTPFMYLCGCDNIELLKLLIDRNVNLNNVNKYGYNCLLLSCKHLFVDSVLYLLSIKNIDVNFQNTKTLNTALHELCLNGDIHNKLFERLLKDKRVDANIKNKDGLNVFNMACMFMKRHIIQKLLKYNKVDVDSIDNNGNSGLMNIFNINNFINAQELELISDIIIYSNMNIKMKNIYDVINDLLSSGRINVYIINNFGDNALSLSIKYKKHKIIELISCVYDEIDINNKNILEFIKINEYIEKNKYFKMKQKEYKLSIASDINNLIYLCEIFNN